MTAFRAGNHLAGAQLVEIFYPELKRLAAGHLRKERQDHSWQPTLLVNELYLQLIKIKALEASGSGPQNDKGAFFALAGQIMRRLLIHHARPLSSKAKKVELWDDLLVDDRDSVVEVEDVLARLAAIRPILRTVVERKVFEGRTAEEIAAQLGCATVTVHRHWQFARHWMQNEWNP